MASVRSFLVRPGRSHGHGKVIEHSQLRLKTVCREKFVIFLDIGQYLSQNNLLPGIEKYIGF